MITDCRKKKLQPSKINVKKYEDLSLERAALEEYRGRCLTLGREVLVDGRRGVARAVGEDYSLLVEWQDGSAESLRCGEVSVRGLYGYV